jgi:hypothetical protein
VRPSAKAAGNPKRSNGSVGRKAVILYRQISHIGDTAPMTTKAALREPLGEGRFGADAQRGLA